MKVVLSLKKHNIIVYAIILVIIICILGIYWIFAMPYNKQNTKLSRQVENRQNIFIKKDINAQFDSNIEAKLCIPKLQLETSIFSNMSDKNLETSLCKLWGPTPNEIGNYVVAGNIDLLRELSMLSNGDTFEVYTISNNNCVTYEIYDIYVSKSNDVTSTSQLTNGEKEVTLMMALDNGIKRLVVKSKAI